MLPSSYPHLSGSRNSALPAFSVSVIRAAEVFLYLGDRTDHQIHEEFVLEISFSKEQIDRVCHAICLKFHLEPSWNHLEPMVNPFGQRFFRKTIFENLKKRLKKDWKDVMQVSQPGQSWHCCCSREQKLIPFATCTHR